MKPCNCAFAYVALEPLETFMSFKDSFDIQLECATGRLFKPCVNDHKSVKQVGEKGKTHDVLFTENSRGNLLPTCTIFHLILRSFLEFFLKTFLRQMKPSKCTAKERMWVKESGRICGGDEKLKQKLIFSIRNRNLQSA